MTSLETRPPIDENSVRRFFSELALAPIFELNSLLLDALIDAASRPASASQLSLAVALKAPLSRLDAAARQRCARSPVCFVDAGFRDNARWATVATRGDIEFPSRESAFPRLQALQLSHLTLTLAWTVTRASLESASVIFGMTRKCASTVARLGIHTMQRLAERHPDWIRPAWENRPEIWHHLLAMAAQDPQPRLPPVSVRALQRQLADLEPATCASGEIRQNRR